MFNCFFVDLEMDVFKKTRDSGRTELRERERERKFWGGVRDTVLCGGRKSIVCEKVPRLRPLVLLVRVRVKVKALE
jgi:hypothetical protein